MLFVITAFDWPGALERRMQVRPAHLDHLQSEAGRIKVSGPLLDQDEQPIGSLLIIGADDRHAAESFAAGEPYRRQGGIGARRGPGLAGRAGALGGLNGRDPWRTG